MNKIIGTIIAVSLIYSAETIDVKEKKRDNSFIDKVQTADPDAQLELNQLKKEFTSKRNQINEKYDFKRQALKKQQKQEMDNLRDAYKNKLKRLKSKYPKKINRESRKHIKPLGKKDSRYLDPRKSDINVKGYKEKEDEEEVKTHSKDAKQIKKQTKPKKISSK